MACFCLCGIIRVILALENRTEMKIMSAFGVFYFLRFEFLLFRKCLFC